MANAALSDSAHEVIHEARGEALRLVLLASVGAFTILVVFGVTGGVLSSWLPAVVLATGVGLSWWLRGWGATASLMLLAAMLGTIVVAISLYPTELAVLFLPVVVVTATVTLGPRAGLGAAAIATLTLLAIAQWQLAPLAHAWAVAGSLACWGTAVALLLGLYPLHGALDWTWRGHLEGIELTKSLRQRQEELGLLSKSLNEACLQLENANRDLERARRAAVEARRLRDEFAATVSHEMRTPLNMVIGFAELMVLDPRRHYGAPLPAAFESDLEAIYRNACHLSNLIDDILDLSQIEARRMALQKERVPLARIVDDAVTVVSRIFERRGLAVSIQLPADLPPLTVDRIRVRQVLVNLLGNAAAFTFRGGVTITAVRRENDCIVAVADTGTGIASDDLPRVFEEFHRLRQGATARTGSGLGLAISKRLIELHGGNMWVDSQIDAGSTFYFSLPCQDTVAADVFRAPWESWARVSDTGQRTVLVLDPEGECERILRRYLDGFNVLAIDSVDEARAINTRVSVAALVVPTTSTTTLPENGDRLPFPLVTCAIRGVRARRDDLGVADYLLKPVSRDQLRGALRKVGPRPRRILVVDDDAEMVTLLEKTLRSLSRQYTVLSATSGEEALALMQTRPPDVVLLDLLMPELSGTQLLDRMRDDARLRDVPVIVVSAREPSLEKVVVTDLRLQRGDGFSVAEFITCLEQSLAALLPPGGGEPAARRYEALPG